MSDKDVQKRLEANVSSVMATSQGKDVIWEILSLCGIYDSQFTGNSGTFFNEGRRSVGLDIIQMLQDAEPTMYAQLLLEQAKLGDTNE